ncbi:MAG TPA: glycine/betaine ABC transporter ATP-binding protein [Eubacteriaceae bacterium]|nr:glycine/betaine ABC transporter ATP-binding protein [Eubacteriaceae bacterium]
MLEWKEVNLSYNGKENVLKNIDLTVEKGDLVTIVGPSGCGKTTLLKTANKMIVPNKGSISLQGRDLKNIPTIELRRSIGYVIQQIGLFPHLTIEDNISYVLKLQQTEHKTRERRTRELLELVGLSSLDPIRRPSTLSGGQKQRIGVARALAADPDIILMDEPFGAVDDLARTQLQNAFLDIQKKLKKTILFVTHDIHEALKLGSKILLMNKGSIEQYGTAEELVFHPKTAFVKSFFGLKGFQSMLDEELLSDYYEKILSGEKTIQDLFVC